MIIMLGVSHNFQPLCKWYKREGISTLENVDIEKLWIDIFVCLWFLPSRFTQINVVYGKTSEGENFRGFRSSSLNRECCTTNSIHY